MFVKLALFVCVVSISVQCGNSSPDDDEFGTFWGPCPESPIKASTTVRLSNILGKWYTHRIVGQYSPWKYFDCQSHTIQSNRRKKIGTVTSRFDLPDSQQILWNGTVEPTDKKRGIFDFEYSGDDWYLSQTVIFNQTYPRGAALAWSCFEFGIFHIESIAVMTKYQDPNDSRIDPNIFKNMNKTLEDAGISPDWFQPINQNNCESSSLSSVEFGDVMKFVANNPLKTPILSNQGHLSQRISK